MSYEIQKAGMMKRASAFLLDLILFAILATGAFWGLSAALDYDGKNEKLRLAYTAYEEKYSVSFDITEDDYLAMSDEERARFDEAYEALNADDEASALLNVIVNLTLVILSLGIFFAFFILEFLVPLLLGNGQTVGKKVFGLGLVRSDSVKISPLMLFIRTVLGKYTVETMVPVLIGIMILFGMIGALGLAILLGILILQIALICASPDNCAIHDRLSGTVCVELSSQLVFETEADLIDYQKRMAAEAAARSE